MFSSEDESEDVDKESVSNVISSLFVDSNEELPIKSTVNNDDESDDEIAKELKLCKYGNDFLDVFYSTNG